MQTRAKMWWVTARDSLWFLPGVMTIASVGLAVGLVSVDRTIPPDAPFLNHFIFTGGAEGARGVLSAIAGGLITVTGVVFSVTIVALQLASSQYTPRVLRNFTADRLSQVVLGVLIGTFTYTVVVLRAVRSAGAGSEEFVPRIAVATAVCLVLISIGLLIFFINHAARSIQIYFILQRIARETVERIRHLRVEATDPPDPRRGMPPTSEEPRVITAGASGYLQAYDEHRLFNLAEKHGVTLRMEPHVGTFILAGEPLVTVWPPGELPRELVSGVRRAFVQGPERTPEQDIEFGIVEISDIAVKALSPGINDPTTAFSCIDRQAEILAVLAVHSPRPPLTTSAGEVFFIPQHESFDRVVSVAFDQIRHFGAGNPAIVKKLLGTLRRLEALAPPHHTPPLRRQIEDVLRSANVQVEEPEELRRASEVAHRPERGAGGDETG